MTKETVYVGLHVGDLHVGSAVSPCPASFVTSNDDLHTPNFAQGYLNECWADMIAHLPRLDYICLGGDMIDGKQPKDRGQLIWEPSALHQARAAWKLLQPLLAKLKRGGHVWYIRGTGYHVGEVGEWDEWLAQQCQAEKRRGRYSRRWLLFEMGGIGLDVAHRQSGMIRYRTTPLAREIEFAENRCAKTGEVAPYGFVRHHTHGEYNTAGLGLRVAVEVPAWKLQDEFAQGTISPNRYYSAHIGSVLAYIDPGRLAEHRRPVVWRELLYPHPQPEREAL